MGVHLPAGGGKSRGPAGRGIKFKSDWLSRCFHLRDGMSKLQKVVLINVMKYLIYKLNLFLQSLLRKVIRTIN